jgi:TM2 domain-containing membrane protein YozV
MPPPAPSKTAPPVVRPLAPGAAVLSYLIPGLGQIYQGRVGKGVLFLVCLYGLFFYGMYLGSWKNVYIPDIARMEPNWENNNWHLRSRPLANLYNRLQFAGQFWIGVAAWPAVFQYANYDPNDQRGPLFGTFDREPSERLTNDLIRDSDKHWDLGWIYTVIAGVLNILVIYDALAGPAFAARPSQAQAGQEAAA